MGSKNIFIEGRPRVGKTTLIKALAEILQERAGGFYTEEMRGEGVRGRRGFLLTTLEGKKAVLAEVGAEAVYHVGKYGVHLKVMEEVAVPAIEKAQRDKEWILIDEIGKMEEGSTLFKETLIKVLDSPKRVLATIRHRDSPFTRDLKKRSDVEIIKLTVPTRDFVLSELLKRI